MDDNHEESLHSEEDQVTKIPAYENEGDLKNKDEPASQETVEETEKDEADFDRMKMMLAMIFKGILAGWPHNIWMHHLMFL